MLDAVAAVSLSVSARVKVHRTIQKIVKLKSTHKKVYILSLLSETIDMSKCLFTCFCMVLVWNEVYFTKNWDLYTNIPEQDFIVKVFVLCLKFDTKIALSLQKMGIFVPPPPHPLAHLRNGALFLHSTRALAAPGPSRFCILRISNWSPCICVCTLTNYQCLFVLK